MSFLPELKEKNLRRNEFTMTIKGGGIDGLYSRNQQCIIPVLSTMNDLARAQNFYMMDNNVTNHYLDELINQHNQKHYGQSMNTRQRRAISRSRCMNRIQEVQPNDTVLVTKMTPDASQHKKDTVKKCLLSLPKMQTEYDEDIVPVTKRKMKRKTKVMVRLPQIVCRMSKGYTVNRNHPRDRSKSDQSSEVKIRMSHQNVVTHKPGGHSMSRQPLLMPLKSAMMERVRQEGRDYLAISGPPIELGVERVGWMQHVEGPAPVIIEISPPYMNHFKRDYISENLVSDSIKRERRAWCAWEKLQKAIFNKSAIKALREGRQDSFQETPETDTDNEESENKMIEAFKQHGVSEYEGPPLNILSGIDIQQSVMETACDIAVGRFRSLSEDQYEGAMDSTDSSLFNNLQKYAAHDISHIMEALKQQKEESEQISKVKKEEDAGQK